jgi:hypothetical protein
MTFEQFTTLIDEKIKNRFVIIGQDSLYDEMMDLSSENLTNKKVIRFARQQISSFKTLLIVGISHAKLLDALEWAAISKDLLLDPETADIYLFILWTDEAKPSLDECLRIEASEDFCRKFVLRPDENAQSFIERTFISGLDPPNPVDLGQDPLIAAFAGLEEQFPWFDDAEKAKWRDAFNSGISSYDLFYKLIDHKPENDEAS